MQLRSAFPKTASRKKFCVCPIASGSNRPARRAASRVWARRRKNRVGIICYADHLGTPRAITRTSDNAKVWEWKNDEPFGANLPNENPSALGGFSYNLRFPGQYYDAETGTHFNWHRDYDPTIGRYVQSDPIGLEAGLNTFTYVFSQPLQLVDPKGLEVKLCGRPLLNIPSIFGPTVSKCGGFHVFIDINGDDYGFFSKLDTLYGPGEVRGPRYEIGPRACAKVDCIDENKLRQNIQQSASNPPMYFAFGFNCKKWAIAQLAAAYDKAACESCPPPSK